MNDQFLEGGGKHVWIGLAEVRQRPGAGVLLDRNEAYVNVLAMAATDLDFRQAVFTACAELGFELVELEEAEPFVRRMEAVQVDPTLTTLAREVEFTGQPRFGAFHTWTSET